MGSLLIVIVCAVALGPACDGKTKMLLGTDGSSGMPDSGAGGAGGAPDPGAGGAGGLIAPDSSSCDGSAMAGTWSRVGQRRTISASLSVTGWGWFTTPSSPNTLPGHHPITMDRYGGAQPYTRTR